MARPEIMGRRVDGAPGLVRNAPTPNLVQCKHEGLWCLILLPKMASGFVGYGPFFSYVVEHGGDSTMRIVLFALDFLAWSFFA